MGCLLCALPFILSWNLICGTCENDTLLLNTAILSRSYFSSVVLCMVFSISVIFDFLIQALSFPVAKKEHLNYLGRYFWIMQSFSLLFSNIIIIAFVIPGNCLSLYAFCLHSRNIIASCTTFLSLTLDGRFFIQSKTIILIFLLSTSAMIMNSYQSFMDHNKFTMLYYFTIMMQSICLVWFGYYSALWFHKFRPSLLPTISLKDWILSIQIVFYLALSTTIIIVTARQGSLISMNTSTVFLTSFTILSVVPPFLSWQLERFGTLLDLQRAQVTQFMI